MEVGLVRSIDIDREMQQAYLDYAMSVIVARALPDARDGLKPVHRRILYAMYDMGLRPETAHKKSARIVGEVLGKYHPHGDMAVYEAMARMAQDFSMRCMLVEGQGNFGSVDGDPPAAMRYTEARLAAPAMEMLADIRKNTVDFSDNFDGSLQEPDVLPAAMPNMLVNGATGIAVGMSTNIPPHNLGEVVDALVYMLDNWERLDDVNISDLMRFIQGPDFPTGGLIVQDTHEDDLTVAYGTGRGKVTVQARAHIEEISRGRTRILVTELPYMTNKSSLIERIAELARDGRLEGIADLRDESDRHGMRIVIELTKTAEPEKVLNNLYKSTPMRSTFGIIMLALVEGEPRMLSLKQALRVYLEHRLVVVRRRLEFDLEKARARAHILEGLRVALKYLDEIIELIRKSPDADAARDRLMKRYKLSDLQAQAILDMQLRRLAALERKKIEDEYKEVLATIKALEGVLHSAARMRTLVAAELRQVKEAYADRRRTQIARLGAGSKSLIPVLTAADLLPEREIWVSGSAEGLVSRTLDEKPPRPSGMAAPRFLLQVNTRDTLFLVSTQGDAAGIPVESLPEAENPQNGAPLHKVSALPEGSQLAAMFALPPKDERLAGWHLFTTTRQGLVKKTALEELPGPTGKPFTLVKVNEDDALGWVHLTDGKAQVLLVTADGMAIRFPEDEVRPMGMVAAGVGGIKLGTRDEVVGMALVPAKGEVLLVSADGKAKRIPVDQFPVQGRYGQGVIAWKLPRTTQVAGMAVGKPNLRLTLHLEKLAPKSMRLDEAPQQTRTSAGKAVIEFKSGVKVLAVTTPLDFPRPTSRVSERPARPEEEEAAPAAAKAEQLTFGIEAPAPVAVEKPATRKARAIDKTAEPTPKAPSRRKTEAEARVEAPAARKPRATKTEEPATKPSTKAPAARKPRGSKSTAAAPKAASHQPPAARKPRASKAAEPKPAATTRTRSKAVSEPTEKTPATRKPRGSAKAAETAQKAASRTKSKAAAGTPAKGKPARKAPAKPTPAGKPPAGKKPAGKKPASGS
jgi:DNA gyrase subunit A